jgi:NAD(P)-dependent dehydrogenase (short-subunit alcohol dehydrogenase family)
MKFKNKIVIITGAAGGIGRALTTRFIKEGAKVVTVDITKEVLDKLSLDFGSPDTLFTVVADISSEESSHNLFKEVQQKWRRTDVLINNAGWFPFTDFESITQITQALLPVQYRIPSRDPSLFYLLQLHTAYKK